MKPRGTCYEKRVKNSRNPQNVLLRRIDLFGFQKNMLESLIVALAKRHYTRRCHTWESANVYNHKASPRPDRKYETENHHWTITAGTYAKNCGARAGSCALFC